MTRRIRGRSGDGLTAEQRAMWKARETYCSWGHHKFYPMNHEIINLEHGTMCMDCQMKVAYHLLDYISMPDISIAMLTHERKRALAAREEKATERKVRGDSTASGFVYYMRINGQIKIGYAADVKQRMRNYPPATELLAVEPGTLNTERERHQDFHRDLMRGREWFRESDELAAHIAKVREDCGDPSALAYNFTQKKVA